MLYSHTTDRASFHIICALSSFFFFLFFPRLFSVGVIICVIFMLQYPANSNMFTIDRFAPEL